MMMTSDQKKKEELLNQIDQYGFAMDDILLYLDTHQDDRYAVEYFRCVQKAYKDAVKEYESMFGPLTYDQESEDVWNWISGPWPWEGEQSYVEI